ncbi:MAG: translation initiation factor IF-3 [Verrucomicrobiae bacterium]|nr:translation initiation factor IF-3 [Verrucomicrobiae bacterium]
MRIKERNNFIRVNGKIRVPEIRVVDSEGGQLGVMSTRDALLLAQQRGVDLVEIAPTARPPVCKLIDFGKYKYLEEKLKSESRKHQFVQKVKELKFHVNIAGHDFDTKINHALGFLEHGDKVKMTMVLRGREMSHADIGMGVMQQIKQLIGEKGILEMEPRQIGKNIIMMYNPLPANKRAAIKRHEEGQEEPEKEEHAIDPAKLVLEKVAIKRGHDAPKERTFNNNPFDKSK